MGGAGEAATSKVPAEFDRVHCVRALSAYPLD